MKDEKETTEEKEATEDSSKEDKKLLDDISGQWDKADLAHKEIRDNGFTFNAREEMFLQRYKEKKEDTESTLSTGELTTLAIDSSCRVMAQLPSGRFYNYNGKTGANMIMNLYFKHAVVRNANTGGPLLIKYRMVNMYSRVFPYIPCFIDWKVTDKYVGPDLIVLHPRRFRPQPGKTAIEDMDYCFIETEVSKQWLEDKLKNDPEGTVFKNIQKILDAVKDEGTGAPVTERSVDQSDKTKTGITLRHKLSSNGDWQVWAPFDDESHLLVNEQDYFPGIPISLKMQYPSMDKLGGLTDFDRGEKMQRSIDRLIRTSEDNDDMVANPPAVMDPEDVVLSSIVRKPKAKWFVKNGKVDSIRMQDMSPRGLDNFERKYGIYKGNMLSMGAQTDTAVSASVDPGMGKTPEALKLQGSKQGARDAWDIVMTEYFIDRTHTIMANMIAKKGINEYSFNLFGESIKKIKEEYPDEDLTMFGDAFENGMAKVDPKMLEGEYIFISDEGSTLVKNDDTGVKMMNYIDKYNKYPGIQEDFAASGKKFNQGEAFKRSMLDDGIKDAEKIIVTAENPESVAGVGADGATAGNAVMGPESPGMPSEAPMVQMPASMPLMPDNQPIIAQ